MELEEKKIYFVMSPHINYYHSFRGDSKGVRGFGLDLKIMESILDLLDDCEKRGLCGGMSKVTWDYADTAWSITLQREYQPEILKRIQERCKKGKDEVLICSWSNSCQPMFNIEEMQKHTEWTFSNSLNLGMEDLFPGRVAPYMRTQEAMFTQGMIEPLKKGGIEGLLIYHSAGPFEISRAFVNPRLDLPQRYGLVNFKSTESEESLLMIPTYGFIDIMDHYSIKKYFQHIRRYQKKGLIDDALLVINFDMDSYVWKGIKTSKILRWMPNTRGIPELLEAVDKFDYVELANLIDIIPNLRPRGEITLRPDVADGNFNGYHNWAQKYDNTKMWTLEEQARWMKSAADTISSNAKESVREKIDNFVREKDLTSESYLKNKMLFTSTTNFGMSVPFIHPDRQKTTMVYGSRMFDAAEHALANATKHVMEDMDSKGVNISIIPIIHRGITDKEKIPVESSLLIRFMVPFTEEEKPFPIIQIANKKYDLYYTKNEIEASNVVECILPSSLINENPIIYGKIGERKSKIKVKISKELEGTRSILKNKYITINLDILGKITSISYKDDPYFSGSCIETAVTYGSGSGIRKEPSRNAIYVLKDGSDGFSASVRMVGAFKIAENAIVRTHKILTLYNDLPFIFVKTHVFFPRTFGSATNERGVYTVDTQYDERWIEIMPLEIEPAILGHGIKDPLRIWKHNFMGAMNYFDLDMMQVDNKNIDIDCLVANISDGFMAVTNQEQGLMIGFNALKCANFAFTPIKLKEKGFGNTERERQQIRINPFGTYWGEQLHYWSDPTATGFGQKIAAEFGGTFKSTAPSFNGKQIEFELVLSPYKGNEPPKSSQSFMNHFSLPPLILYKEKVEKIHTNYDWIKEFKENLVDEYGIRDILDLNYLEWVELINKDRIALFEERDRLKLKPLTAIRLLIHGLRGL